MSGSLRWCEVCNFKSTDDKMLTLHNFPVKDRDLLKKWLEVVGMKRSQLKTRSRVCDTHFDKRDKAGYRLKRGAVPSRRLVEQARRGMTGQSKNLPSASATFTTDPASGATPAPLQQQAYFEPVFQIGRIAYVTQGMPLPEPRPISIVTTDPQQLSGLAQLLPGTLSASSQQLCQSIQPKFPAPSLLTTSLPGTLIPLTLPLSQRGGQSSLIFQPGNLTATSTTRTNLLTLLAKPKRRLQPKPITTVTKKLGVATAPTVSPPIPLAPKIDVEAEVITLSDSDDDSVEIPDIVESALDGISPPATSESVDQQVDDELILLSPKSEVLIASSDNEEDEGMIESSEILQQQNEDPLQDIITTAAPTSFQPTVPPVLPPIPGLFAIMGNQVIQIPTGPDNTLFSEQANPAKEKKIKCPFNCKYTFHVHWSLALLRHFDTCPNLRERLKEQDQATTSDESSKFELLFLHCPACNEFSAPLEDKIGFVEHLHWCSEMQKSGQQKASNLAIPPKFRVFGCSVCPKTRYFSLDGFLKHFYSHKRRAYKCALCPRRFEVKGVALRVHWKECHSNSEGAKIAVPSRVVKDTLVPAVPWWCPEPQCQEKFSLESERDEHVTSMHSSSKPSLNRSHKCSWCPNQYFCESELRLHEGTDHILKVSGLPCPICPERFLQTSLLTRHKRLVHNTDLIECKKCELKFAEIEKYKIHIQKDHGGYGCNPGPNTCSLCGNRFARKAALRRHVMIVHEGKGVITTCQFCGRIFTSTGNRRRHIALMHRDKGLFTYHQCPVEGCGKSYYQMRYFKEHLARHERRYLYHCDHCERGYFDKSSYLTHQRQHSNDLPHVCDKCACGFGTPRALKQHQFWKHRDPAIIENEASTNTSKQFFENSDKKATDHEIVTRREPRTPRCSRKPLKGEFVCEYCAKTYGYQVTLHKHIKTVHFRRYEKTCNLCGKKLLQASTLRIHLAQKHGIGLERMFKCEEAGCGKIFYCNSLLQHHRTMHNGQGPQFSCDRCAKQFYYPKQLTQHLRTHEEKGDVVTASTSTA